jgi:thiol-disulfide isomerase/thioredoxin
MARTLAVLSMILLGACEPKPSAQASGETPSLINEQVSTIRLRNLDGEVLKPAEGKILILNLWATWCKPCIEEMPALERMAKQLPDSFELILASDEELKRINGFVAARSLELTFAQLETALDALGVYSLPTTLIIGSDGEILETIVGTRTWDSPEQIDQLLTFLK